MLTIPIRMWDGRKMKVLAVLEITNDATGTSELGNYIVKLDQKEGGNKTTRGQIKNWPRERPAHELVFEALRAIIREDG